MLASCGNFARGYLNTARKKSWEKMAGFSFHGDAWMATFARQ